MNRCPGLYQFVKKATRRGRDWPSSAHLLKRRRYVMRRYKAKSLFVIKIQGLEFSVADADGFLKHDSKDRLKIARRATDNLKHL
jgi:hypothetical protein